jgi:hypothetical protein
MRAQATDKPFQEDLEDSGGYEGIQDPDNGVVDISETADADLADQNDDDRYQDAQHSRCPNGNDLVAQWVGELRIDDLAILEVNGERAGWCWMCFLDLGALVSGISRR